MSPRTPSTCRPWLLHGRARMRIARDEGHVRPAMRQRRAISSSTPPAPTTAIRMTCSILQLDAGHQDAAAPTGDHRRAGGLDPQAMIGRQVVRVDRGGVRRRVGDVQACAEPKRFARVEYLHVDGHLGAQADQVHDLDRSVLEAADQRKFAPVAHDRERRAQVDLALPLARRAPARLPRSPPAPGRSRCSRKRGRGRGSACGQSARPRRRWRCRWQYRSRCRRRSSRGCGDTAPG